MLTRSHFLNLSAEERTYELYKAVIGGLVQNGLTSIIGAGTPYSLTNTAAAVDLGTTDPAFSLPAKGTYLLFANATVEAAAATITTQTATLKLRRTNNTATDVTNGSKTIDLPVMTTLTHTIGDFTIGPVMYDTTLDDDIISLFASLSAAAGAGNINISQARILALRLY